MPDHKPEPTNADLMVQIENQTDAFKEHAADDHKVAKKQAEVNEKQTTVNDELRQSLAALHEWKAGVATKDDIKELKEFMGQVKIGTGIFKFTWNNAAKIGSFLMLVVGVVLLFKVGVAGAVAWFLGK